MAMSVAEMAEYLNKPCSIRVEPVAWQVPAKITNVREVWGRVDVEVIPAFGDKPEAWVSWVSLDRVTFA